MDGTVQIVSFLFEILTNGKLKEYVSIAGCFIENSNC